MPRLQLLASLVLVLYTHGQSSQPPFERKDATDVRNQPRDQTDSKAHAESHLGNATMALMKLFLHRTDNTSTRQTGKYSSLNSALTSGLKESSFGAVDTRQSPHSSCHSVPHKSSHQIYNIQQVIPVSEQRSAIEEYDHTDQYLHKQFPDTKKQETTPRTDSLVMDSDQSPVLTPTDASALNPGGKAANNLNGVDDVMADSDSAIMTPVDHGKADSAIMTPVDHGKDTLTSLLKESFLIQNPNQMKHQVSGDSVKTQTDVSLSHPRSVSVWSEDSTALSHAENGPQYSDDKKDKRNQGQMLSSEANNRSPTNMEHRSGRCPIPDVLVGEEELPWSCRQHFVWRRLGEHVYPSRFYEAVCESSTCWYGHFNCTPVTYTVHVLHVCLGGCHDQRVPSPLRLRWQWTPMALTVGCQCVR